MNKKGEKYKQDTNKRFKEFLIEGKKMREKINSFFGENIVEERPTFSKEAVLERKMRLGIEHKLYDLDESEHEEFAILTLKEELL
jgi:hypothetical protein